MLNASYTGRDIVVVVVALLRANSALFFFTPRAYYTRSRARAASSSATTYADSKIFALREEECWRGSSKADSFLSNEARAEHVGRQLRKYDARRLRYIAAAWNGLL